MDPTVKKALFKTIACGTGRWLNDATPAMSQDERNNLIGQYDVSGPSYGEFQTWYATEQTQLALRWYFLVASGNDAYYKPGVFAYDERVIGARFPQPA